MLQVASYYRSATEKQQCSYAEPVSCNSLSRSLEDVVLDLLRGKVTQCYEQLCNNQYDITGSHVSCTCKFLVIVDCPVAPQYWVIQLKTDKMFKSANKQSQKNYLNCIDSLELYYNLDDVCKGSNCVYKFSNKNWFFFENILKINVANDIDVLLEDFTHCQNCC